MTATMLVLSLGPMFGGVTLLAALVVLVVFVLIHGDRQPNLAQPHDPEREYRRLQFKVRHPWKARISRFIGVD